MAAASEGCWSEQYPDPLSAVVSVWLGCCSSGLMAAARGLLFLVLWGCGREEQGSWGSD